MSNDSGCVVDMEHHKLRLEGVDMEHLSSISRAGPGAKLETKLTEQLNIAKAIFPEAGLGML